MEKQGPDSTTLTYDFLKWAIPTLKKFPRDQRHFQDAGKQPYDRDAMTLPWRTSTSGRQKKIRIGNTYPCPPENTWPPTV